MKGSSRTMTRRFFIGGAASLGAVSLGKIRAAPAGVHGRGRPNLVLGVISDVHIASLAGQGSDEIASNVEITFERALRWFGEQGVDAVVLAGDMSDWGMDEGLVATGTAWERVFPNDRAPDGRKVEKLFIYGNHESFSSYGDYPKRLYPDEAERNRHMLRCDMPGWWKRVFHEDYSRLYEKTVKGYRFVGCHWDVHSGKGNPHELIRDYMAEKGKLIDPSRPFFYIQHPPLQNTTSGSWAWDHDYGVATKALAPFPNAVAISGHTHYSLTDERSIWQGAFTAVDAGSLSYTDDPRDSCSPAGYENTRAVGADAAKIDKAKMMPCMGTRDVRQGMLWRIYDDCIVMRRRDFVSGLDLGDDWVLPLPTAESRPFAYAARAKKLRPPQFPAHAAVRVARVKATNRANVEKDAIDISAPPPAPLPNGRLFELEFVVAGDGKKAVKRVLAPGFNAPPGHKRALADSHCVFALDELPPGRMTVSVMPLNSYGQRGNPLAAEFGNEVGK